MNSLFRTITALLGSGKLHQFFMKLDAYEAKYPSSSDFSYCISGQKSVQNKSICIRTVSCFVLRLLNFVLEVIELCPDISQVCWTSTGPPVKQHIRCLVTFLLNTCPIRCSIIIKIIVIQFLFPFRWSASKKEKNHWPICLQFHQEVSLSGHYSVSGSYSARRRHR